MSFNPQPNNLGPKMIFDGLQMEARMGQRNKEMDQHLLMQGLESVSQAVGQAGQIYAKNKAQRGMNDGTATAMQEQGYGAPKFWDEFAATKDEDKRSGMLAAGMASFDNYQKLQRQKEYLKAQNDMSLDLAKQKADLSRPRQLSQAEIDAMTNAGYVQNPGTNDLLPDRSKFQSSSGGTFGDRLAERMAARNGGAGPAAGGGGYIPGKSYSGRKYLGGDPALEASWK